MIPLVDLTGDTEAFEYGARFNPGMVVTTPGVKDLIVTMDDPLSGFMRLFEMLAAHATGDWGDMPAEDAEANELALSDGSRLMSAYSLDGRAVWVITEADRSATTFLLPSEY